MSNFDFSTKKRLVIKVGSSLVTADGCGVDKSALQQWAQQILSLKKMGHEIILVSSGAIAEGMKRLGWQTRPIKLHELQAAAAVGQLGLAQAYEEVFKNQGLICGQILLTHDDLKHRTRYLNARSSLETLLNQQIIPIINENDAVIIDEIKFGDNDTLSALVANLIHADLLIILTDQQGLYDCDPRKNPEAKFISKISVYEKNLEKMAGGAGSGVGTGGMYTKVLAAKRAALSGTATVVASGRENNVLPRIIAGEALGTLFYNDNNPISAKKQWLLNQLHIAGKVIIDDGAVEAIQKKQKSLLAVGCLSLQGDFHRGELLSVIDKSGNEIARGLSSYDRNEAERILGVNAQEISKVLGYVYEEALIHRDNLAILL